MDVTTLMQCCIDLKPTRKENEVYIDRKIDVTELVKYMEDCRKEGKKYTYFHAFMTAIAKVRKMIEFQVAFVNADLDSLCTSELCF